MSTFELTFRLGKNLLPPAIRYCFKNSNGIQRSSMQKIQRMLTIRNIHRPAVGNVVESVGRCGICNSEIVGTDKYKQKRGMLHNRVGTKRQKCQSLTTQSLFPPRLCFMRRLICYTQLFIYNYNGKCFSTEHILEIMLSSETLYL